MDIAIIGAGAAGMLFAGRLSSAGYNVLITDKSLERISAVRKKGIKILSPDGKEVLASKPYAAAQDELQSSRFRGCDYYIFCVKAFSTAEAAEAVSIFAGSNSIAVTFQNGAGNIEKIAQFFKTSNIAAGTTTEGATFLSPGSVIHGGNGKTQIGMIGNGPGQKERLMPLVEALSESGFSSAYSSNPKKLIWEKLAVNACINPLTALTGAANGFVSVNRHLMAIAKMISEEVCAAASSGNINLDSGSIYRSIIDVAEKTSENRSSMLQDISAGRKTEIDQISGFIAEKARQAGNPADANTALHLIVKALEDIKKI